MAWKSVEESWWARTKRKQRQEKEPETTRKDRLPSFYCERLSVEWCSIFPFLPLIPFSVARMKTDCHSVVLRFPLLVSSNFVPSNCFSLFIRIHGTSSIRSFLYFFSLYSSLNGRNPIFFIISITTTMYVQSALSTLFDKDHIVPRCSFN